MRSMQRLSVVTVTAAMFVAVLAGSALADKPATFEGSVTFPDDNPCTDQFDPNEHLVTIEFVVSIHSHTNNTVTNLQLSGSTSSGFTMVEGTENHVTNMNVEKVSGVHQWIHPDGSVFQAKGLFVFNANTGEVLVEQFGLTCLRSS